MFTETLERERSVIGIACEGELTQDDLERIDALLETRLPAVDAPGLLVDLTGFDSYEDPRALGEDVESIVSHCDRFRRIAVLAEKDRLDLGETVASLTAVAEVRTFVPWDRTAATRWAASGRSSSVET